MCTSELSFTSSFYYSMAICLFIICIIVYNLCYCCYAKTSASAVQKVTAKCTETLSPPPSTQFSLPCYIPREECPCYHQESSPTYNCPAHPLSALPPCRFLPLEFLQCNQPVDHEGNTTAKVCLRQRFRSVLFWSRYSVANKR